MGDPYKKDNIYKGFKVLKQKGSRLFILFYFSFYIYINYLKLNKKTIIDKLKNKINLYL